VARSVSPSVVFIQVEGTQLRSSYHHFPMLFEKKWPFQDDLFERFFGERFGGFSQPKSPRRQPKIVGQGSGFVFSSKDSLFFGKSYILTNNHVVANAEKIKVTLQDKREFEAHIVGTDPKSDVALLEIKIDKLPVHTLGDSSTL
jgi:serine protease Do